MNKFVVIAALLLLVAGFVVLSSSKDTSPQESMTEEHISTSPSESEMVSDQYVQYSTGILESVQEPRRVLFFYASWCPTCRPADKSLQENVARLPEDVVVIRVNYNDPETDQEEKDLAKKYEIGYQHIFVQIDTAGNKLHQWTGGEIEELLKNLK